MSRRDLVKYLEVNGFRLLCEGANHSIYIDGQKAIPIKRHRQFDRITANFANKRVLPRNFGSDKSLSAPGKTRHKP